MDSPTPADLTKTAPRLLPGLAFAAAATLIALLATATASADLQTTESVGGVVLLIGLGLSTVLAFPKVEPDQVTFSQEDFVGVAAFAIGGPIAVILTQLAAVFGSDAFGRQVDAYTPYNYATSLLASLAGGAALTTVADHASSPWTVLLLGGFVAGIAYTAVTAGVLMLWSVAGMPTATAVATRRMLPVLIVADGAAGFLAAGVYVAWSEMGVIGVAVTGAPAVVLFVTAAPYVKRLAGALKAERSASAAFADAIADRDALLETLAAQNLAVVRGLARTMDAKDRYTAGHTERVAAYARLLAVELGLAPDVREAIEHGAILHDIGKIGVADRILRKPSPLDAEEWQEIRRHPEIACFILEGIEVRPEVLDVVRSHHENLDGSGYPDGLVAAQVSIAARIGRVADAFDAMTSDRPYRGAMTVAEAYGELCANTGTQFDPDVVAALGRLVDSRRLDDLLATRPIGESGDFPLSQSSSQDAG